MIELEFEDSPEGSGTFEDKALKLWPLNHLNY